MKHWKHRNLTLKEYTDGHAFDALMARMRAAYALEARELREAQETLEEELETLEDLEGDNFDEEMDELDRQFHYHEFEVFLTDELGLDTRDDPDYA